MKTRLLIFCILVGLFGSRAYGQGYDFKKSMERIAKANEPVQKIGEAQRQREFFQRVILPIGILIIAIIVVSIVFRKKKSKLDNPAPPPVIPPKKKND